MPTTTEGITEALEFQRDFFKFEYDKVIAGGAGALDPMRNWLQGRYESYNRAIEIVAEYQ
jgi:hypothetical protein